MASRQTQLYADVDLLEFFRVRLTTFRTKVAQAGFKLNEFGDKTLQDRLLTLLST